MKEVLRQEYSLNEIEKLASKVLELLKKNNCRIIGFEGDLGAGKTTFIKSLLKKLGINSSKSPSFTLIREYKKIAHCDFYRRSISWEEFEELVEDKEFVFIEWINLTQFNYDAKIVIEKGEDKRWLYLYI